MFRTFGIDLSLFLDDDFRQNPSSDFRGVLVENCAMQALAANGLRTFCWVPTDKVGNGEIDFVFQNNRVQIIPVEVKSAWLGRAGGGARRGPWYTFAVTSERQLAVEGAPADGPNQRKRIHG